MKKLLLPVFLIITILAGAQDIVINEVDADNPSPDVWDILKETDIDPSNSDNATMFYTG